MKSKLYLFSVLSLIFLVWRLYPDSTTEIRAECTDKGFRSRIRLISPGRELSLLLDKPGKNSDLGLKGSFSSTLLLAGQTQPRGLFSLLRRPLEKGAASDSFDQGPLLACDIGMEGGGSLGFSLLPRSPFPSIFYQKDRLYTTAALLRLRWRCIILEPAAFICWKEMGEEHKAEDSPWYQAEELLPGASWMLCGGRASFLYQHKRYSMGLHSFLYYSLSRCRRRGRLLLLRGEASSREAALFLLYGHRSASFFDLNGDRFPDSHLLDLRFFRSFPVGDLCLCYLRGGMKALEKEGKEYEKECSVELKNRAIGYRLSFLWRDKAPWGDGQERRVQSRSTLSYYGDKGDVLVRGARLELLFQKDEELKGGRLERDFFADLDLELRFGLGPIELCPGWGARLPLRPGGDHLALQLILSACSGRWSLELDLRPEFRLECSYRLRYSPKRSRAVSK